MFGEGRVAAIPRTDYDYDYQHELGMSMSNRTMGEARRCRFRTSYTQ